MADDSLKLVGEVALDNYDQLVIAVATIINDVLRKLVQLKIITIDNKQLIQNEKSDQLQAECLLDRFILNRVGSGEDKLLFTLLEVLNESGKCNSIVSKIYTDLGRPLPSPGLPENSNESDDSEVMPGLDPKTSKLILGIVVPRVSAYWDTIAAFLEYPIPKTKEIERHCRGDPRQCCKMLLENWFCSENGVKPKKWSKLAQVLSEISDIAASTVQIKKLLHDEGVI